MPRSSILALCLTWAAFLALSATALPLTPFATDDSFLADRDAKILARGEGWGGNQKATFFYQNNTPGACGKVHSDWDKVVALQTSAYAGGSNCGKKISVTRNGKTVTGTVADECPSEFREARMTTTQTEFTCGTVHPLTILRKWAALLRSLAPQTACEGTGHIDLSKGFFDDIATEEEGMVSVSWTMW